jgi:predicted PurR-regulated permease PerM
MTLLAACVSLFLLWRTTSSLLIIFAGVLLAALLDALTRALAYVLSIGRVLRLTLVLLIVTALMVLGIRWGVGRLPEQTRLLIGVMDAQLDVVQQHLLSYGITLLGPEGGRDFAQWLFSDQGRLLTHVQLVLGRASSFLTGAVVILFLGILFAIDPTVYRESLVALVRRSYRARTRAILDEMGRVLRLWLVGQLVRVLLMTFCVWAVLYLIGLPGSFLLGLQAGFSNFIPYLGPIVAAVPIGLVAMPLGASTTIWSLVIYTVVQSIEGYIVGPLIQRQATETPPAWILATIVLFGTLFGVFGIALAMPLVAVARIAIVRFYIEDYLGDERHAPQSAV